MSRPDRRPRGWALSAALVLVPLASGGAQAQEPEGGVEFRWDAPSEGCPSEAEVLAELERLLGGPLASQGEGRLAAIARIRRELDGTWDLRLWTVSERATRQRSMVGEDCAILAEAAALLAAMAIDPEVLTRVGASEAAVEQAERAHEVEDEDEGEGEGEAELEPDEPRTPKEEEEPQRPEVIEPEPEPELEAARRRRFVVALRAQAGGSVADLPGVGPVLRLGLAMQWEHARVELEGHYAFLRRARFAEDADRGANLRHVFGVARGCGVLRHRPAKLEFPICAGVEAGAQFGQGFGFVEVREGTIPWLALDLAPSVIWAPLPQLALGLSVEPWVALLRRRFLAEDGSELWRPGLVGIRVLGGLEVRF